MTYNDRPKIRIGNLELLVNPQSDSERFEKQAQLGHLEPEVIERSHTLLIRDLATGLLKTTENGKRLNKRQLLDKLLPMIAAQRQILVASSAALVETLAASGIDDTKVIELVKSKDPREAARLVYDSLATRMKPITIAKGRTTDIYKLLESATELQVFRIQEFKDEWSGLIAPALNESNSTYEAKVNARMENQREIKAEPVVLFAQDWLESLYEWSEGKTDEDIKQIAADVLKRRGQLEINWQAVTYALSLSTGRRPSEILSTETTFEVTEDGQLHFTGLAKSKTRAGSKIENAREAKECTSPSICPVEHVMNGLRYLTLIGKRTDIAHDNVNSRYSTPLSSDMRQDIRDKLRSMGITNLYDCRHFYANYWKRLHEITPGNRMDSSKYLELIMGHSDAASTASYKDVFVSFAGVDYDDAEETDETIVQA